MANESAFYVEIDGVWHEMDGEVTVCGLTGPTLVLVQTRDVPDEVHCGANAPAEVIETPATETPAAETAAPTLKKTTRKAKAKK